MARAVSHLNGLSCLVDARAGALAWTPYWYCVCLYWMSQTAQTIAVTPDLLEATLFEPPPDRPDENEAAD